MNSPLPIIGYDKLWWKSSIIYQIYPRSFLDTDGNGVGDIEGIRRGLDYLSWLGVEAIWVCPIYPSPMADFGYDIADYSNIDQLFGSLSDFDNLVSDVHQRGMKIILDFVPNHTSHEHPWFQESRSSRTSVKRDWYIWRDGKADGSPPNNWVSQFGGSAWTLDKATDQYYLHSFLPQQPDLNWRNSAVRSAMFQVLRFWLDRGVDGFRVDVLWLLIKDAAFRDNPPNPDYLPTQPAINRYLSIYNSDQPEIHQLIAQMRAVLDEYPRRVLIGEIYLPIDRLVTYYGEQLNGAQLPFNFALIHTKWDADHVADFATAYEAALPPGGWPNWVLGNHDQPRIASRVGIAQARIAAVLLLTLRGTPTMYYGDEIGLARVPVSAELAKDPWAMREPDLFVSRDPWRTPLQWDASPQAGFTTGVPWLPIDPNFARDNIACLSREPRSLLQLYHRLIELKKLYPSLSVGDARNIKARDNVLSYERRFDDERVIIVLNFGPKPRALERSEFDNCKILLSTYLDREGPFVEMTLRGDEGLMLVPGNEP